MRGDVCRQGIGETRDGHMCGGDIRTVGVPRRVQQLICLVVSVRILKEVFLVDFIGILESIA